MLGLFLHLCLWLPRCLHPNEFIIFLAILQHSDSGHWLHRTTSPWLLLTGRLISLLSDLQTGVDAAAYATLDTEQLISHLRVALLVTLSTLSNSEGGIIPVSEVCELLLKVHDILDMAVSKQVGNSTHILHMCLILFPGSIMRSGLHSSIFFIASGMWFLLVRPVCMVVFTGLLHRLSSSLLWVCLSLFFLRGVARPGHGLDSISQCRRDLCQGLVVIPY